MIRVVNVRSVGLNPLAGRDRRFEGGLDRPTGRWSASDQRDSTASAAAPGAPAALAGHLVPEVERRQDVRVVGRDRPLDQDPIVRVRLMREDPRVNRPLSTRDRAERQLRQDR